MGWGSGLLIKELRPNEPELQAQIIQGGLLHDVGKRSVPEEILNKPGRLGPDEWELVKRHPEAGYEELRKVPGISATVLEMARDHHERLDGAGYPRGRSGQDVGFAGRVCAVIDVFDAISSARSYRPASPPTEVLKSMQAGSGTQFDPEILQVWARQVQQLVEQDPRRAPASSGAPAPHTCAVPEAGVREVQPGGQARDKLDAIWADERRRHPRFACRTAVQVTFIRQGKPGQLKPGERIGVEMIDISRGGLQMRTAWPLTMNDLLEVELPGQNGTVARRWAQVVRVRRSTEGGWVSGLCFVSRVEPLQSEARHKRARGNRADRPGAPAN